MFKNLLVTALLICFISTIVYAQTETNQVSKHTPHGPEIDNNVINQLQKNYAPKVVRSDLSQPKDLSIYSPILQEKLLNGEVIDNKGTEFWVCFQQNYDDAELSFKFFITSDVNTNCTISIPSQDWSQSYSVIANQITTVELPSPSTLVISSSEIVETKTIHILADEEITVYGLNQREYSTDAYIALPLDILNIFYLIVSYPSITDDYNQSQFAIVSPYDNVKVDITPSANTEGGHTAGQTFSVTLNKGQAYQVQAYYGLDLTGSIIQSSLPVAVFSGHSCANVPTDYAYCDHLVEQLPPTNTWGNSFVTMPLAGRENGDTFRILASQDGTDLSINGSNITTLNFGDYYETIIDVPSQISSSKPVIVMQYSNGNTWDPNLADNGDPFMMLIPPFEQFMANYSFSTLSSWFITNYITLTIETDGISSLLLDGVSVDPGLFQAIGTSGFSGASIPIEIGSHHVENTSGYPFGVYSYGFKADDSYGYAGGLSLEFIYEGSAPVIYLTDETKYLNEQAQIEGSPLTISSLITDDEEPYTLVATLFYKNPGSDVYNSVSMSPGDNNIWSAIIPAEAIIEPGVLYYLYATDGQLSSTNPTINPSDNPYSIAVLPNQNPYIEHIPVTHADLGQDITIIAEITDITHYVNSASMFYRIPGGNPVYTEVQMSLVSGNQYEAVIPGPEVSALGIEYYIQAIDDLGMSGFKGYSQNPFLITVGIDKRIALTQIYVKQEGGSNFETYPLRTALGIKKGDLIRFEGIVKDSENNVLPGQEVKVYNPFLYDPDNNNDGKELITTDQEGKFFYPSQSGSISLEDAAPGVMPFWFNVLNTNEAVPFCLVINDISLTVDEINKSYQELTDNEPSIIDIKLDTSSTSPFRELYIPAEAYPASDANLDHAANNNFFTFFSIIYVGPTDEKFLLTQSYNSGWLRRGFDLYQSKIRTVLENMPERFNQVMPGTDNNSKFFAKINKPEDYDPLEKSNLWWYVGEGLVCASTLIPTGVTQAIGPVGCVALKVHLASDAIKYTVTSDALQDPFGLDGNDELDAGLEWIVDVGVLLYSTKDMPKHLQHWHNPRNFMHGKLGRVNAGAEMVSYVKDIGQVSVGAWEYNSMYGTNYQNMESYYKGTEYRDLVFTSPSTGTTTDIYYNFTRSNLPQMTFAPFPEFDDPENPSFFNVYVNSSRPVFEPGTINQSVPIMTIANMSFPMENITLPDAYPFTYMSEVPVSALPNYDPANPVAWSEPIYVNGSNFETIWGACTGGYCGLENQTLLIENDAQSIRGKNSSATEFIVSLDIPAGTFNGQTAFVALSLSAANILSATNSTSLVMVSSIIEITSGIDVFTLDCQLSIPFKRINEAQDISIYYFDGEQSVWSAVQTQIDFLDSVASANINQPGKYALFLKRELTNIEEEGISDVLQTFELSQNYPNPFNPTTTIKYKLTSRSLVRLDVYNVLGQKVRGLIEREIESGTHTIIWDGADDHGNLVPSGVYYYRIMSDDSYLVKKMVMLK